MRILLSADAEIPVPPDLYGGIERIVDSLITRFRELGHEVGLLAHRDSKSSCSHFYPWPSPTSTQIEHSFRNALALREAANSFKPDVLHSFSRLAWLTPLVFPGTYREFPILMSYQREPTGRTISWSRRIHGERLRFTACSEQLARKGRLRGGGDWKAVPNFVDLKQFTFVSEIPPDAPILFLSRVEEIKGAHWAVEIARKSKRKLIIAGNRPEGQLHRSFWNKKITPHIDGDQIRYVGPVNNQMKNELLGQAAAMVVPIQWDEPFGIVFAEALACGTPVISCPRGALPEIINQTSIGKLVRTIDEGVEAVGSILNFNREQCRRHVEECYSLDVVSQRYLDLYQFSISR
ncbi:MAG: glycosyltransferase [Verrucomicrobiota bacterium]